MTHKTSDGGALETTLIAAFSRQLNSAHHLYLAGNALSYILSVESQDIDAFASHWRQLTLDRHMGDGGRYRYRRYGEFDAPPGAARRQLPHGPYVQPRYVNRLNGDVARLFDPLEPAFVADTVLERLLDWLTSLCDSCEGRTTHWNIRLHPYRILASAQAAGQPTPEGLHRDGVDHIVSVLIKRHNVAGGETSLTDNDGRLLWRKTLQNPLDILVGQDALTMHSVTPITPIDPGREAYRDVLVVAFTRAQT